MSSNGDKVLCLEKRRLTDTELTEAFKHTKNGFMKYYFRVGPKGFFYSDSFEPIIPEIYNLELRPGDIFVATFPKAGTTWAQELVWMIANNFDYDTAKSVPLVERFPFLEFSVFTENDLARGYIKRAIEKDQSLAKLAEHLQINGPDLVTRMPSPRFMKTHQPFSLLPPDILDKTKVVYVSRDPRDVAVSYFHHLKIMRIYGFEGEFKDFLELFKKDMVEWGPYFAHFREAWELKDHPNMLLLFYEELSKDLPAAIRRVAKFLGKTVTEEQLSGLCEHLKFENFKKNSAVNYDAFNQLGIIDKGKSFIRKARDLDR